jgi:hypothetical protein
MFFDPLLQSENRAALLLLTPQFVRPQHWSPCCRRVSSLASATDFVRGRLAC